MKCKVTIKAPRETRTSEEGDIMLLPSPSGEVSIQLSQHGYTTTAEISDGQAELLAKSILNRLGYAIDWSSKLKKAKASAASAAPATNPAQGALLDTGTKRADRELVNLGRVEVVWSEDGNQIFAKFARPGRGLDRSVDVTEIVNAFDLNHEIRRQVTARLRSLGYKAPTDRGAWKIQQD